MDLKYRKWQLQIVVFLHFSGLSLNLHFHLDLSVSDSEPLPGFSVEILRIIPLNSLALFPKISVFHWLCVLLSLVA